MLAALLGLMGCDNPTEANAPPVEVHTPTALIGTWESKVNTHKWQIDASGATVKVHGWDQTTGRAFAVKEIDYNGSLLTFETGTGASHVEHAFRMTGDGTMNAHCEGESLGEVDFELVRIPGTGPTLGSGRSGP